MESSQSLPPFSEISESLQILPDTETRLEYLISLGRQLSPIPEEERVDSNRVWGCMASVWLTCAIDQNNARTFHFKGYSDSVLVSGIVAIIVSLYSDRSAQQILELDSDEAFASLNLDAQLSTARRTGLTGMIQKIRQYAVEHL